MAKTKAAAPAAAVEQDGRFRTRPLEVQAVQFDGENVAEVAVFLAPVGGPHNPKGATARAPISVLVTCGAAQGHVVVPHPGAWLVRSVRGVEVMGPDEFAASYEPMGAPSASGDGD